MSLLVTVARYRTITGDSSSTEAVASAAIEDATDLLSEALGRPGALKSTERTESMRVGANGDLHPLAVPVTDVDGYDSFSTHTIYGASADAGVPFGLIGSDVPSVASVTYTGGWTERSANVGDPDALPAYIERDIAAAAYAVIHGGAPMLVPAGAVSASVGDASVSFGSGGAAGGGSSRIAWSPETMRWRRRYA